MPPPVNPTDPHSLSATETSLRFQEPYVTDGINRRLSGIIPPGIYWGFRLGVTGVADEVEILSDPVRGDSLAVYETSAHRSLAHRVAGDFTVTLDTSYRGTEVILALYTQYTVGSTTTSVIRAYTPAQFATAVEAPEVVVLGHVNVPSDGVVLASGITGEDRVVAGVASNTWAQIIPNPDFARKGMGWITTASVGSFSMTTTAGRLLPGQTAALLFTATGTATFTLTARLDQPVHTDRVVRYRLWIRRLIAAAGGTLTLVFTWVDQNGDSSSNTVVTLDATGTDSTPVEHTGGIYPPAGAARLLQVSVQGGALTYASAAALVLNALEVFVEPTLLRSGANLARTVLDASQVNLYIPGTAESAPYAKRVLTTEAPSTYLGAVLEEGLSDGNEIQLLAGQFKGGRGITDGDSPYEARFSATPAETDQTWVHLLESVGPGILGARVFFLAAETGSPTKLALVMNAYLTNDSGVKWTKDVAGNPAFRLVLAESNVIFETRASGDNGTWTDSAWVPRTELTAPAGVTGGGLTADALDLGTTLTTALQALVPRVQIRETAGEARSLALQIGDLRFWVQPGSVDQFEVTLNAVWDGTNWTAFHAGTASTRVRIRAGFVYLETIPAGASPWNDAAWVHTSVLSLFDGGSTLSLSGGYLRFTNTGGGLGFTNLASTDVPVANTLYATSIPKAWGKIVTDGVGGVTVSGGLNIASVTIVGSVLIQITFAKAFSSADYSATFNPLSDQDDTVVPTGQGTGSISFRYRRAGSALDLEATAVTVLFTAMGLQT